MKRLQPCRKRIGYGQIIGYRDEALESTGKSGFSVLILQQFEQPGQPALELGTWYDEIQEPVLQQVFRRLKTLGKVPDRWSVE